MSHPSRGGRRGAEDAMALRLTGGPEAAAGARRALARLRGDLDPPVMETMRLPVTELVANSVKHTGVRTVGPKPAGASSW